MYQVSAFGDLPQELEKAQACGISTGLLLKAFHQRDVTSQSISRLEQLAVANLETMAHYDPDRLTNRKSHLTVHTTDSVDGSGQGKLYSTGPFEGRHRGIR
jgi:hypothetical protein